MNYLEALARRIRDEVPPDRLPDEDTTDLFRAYAVLGLALGPRVRPSDVHNAWVAWMLALHPDHPSLDPYDELPPDVQRQDTPFVDAIRRATNHLGIAPPG